jgi:hypothetical protein
MNATPMSSHVDEVIRNSLRDGRFSAVALSSDHVTFASAIGRPRASTISTAPQSPRR